MPVRIKELVVKTTINTAQSNTNNNESTELNMEKLNKIKEWILEECLEEVEQLLEKKQQK